MHALGFVPGARLPLCAQGEQDFAVGADFLDGVGVDVGQPDIRAVRVNPHAVGAVGGALQVAAHEMAAAVPLDQGRGRSLIGVERAVFGQHHARHAAALHPRRQDGTGDRDIRELRRVGNGDAALRRRCDHLGIAAIELRARRRRLAGAALIFLGLGHRKGDGQAHQRQDERVFLFYHVSPPQFIIFGQARISALCIASTMAIWDFAAICLAAS